ncbi:MAG: Glycosyl hydrolase family 26/Calx-beta domain, partial [uncultured Thiotrichaceae bacterium]
MKQSTSLVLSIVIYLLSTLPSHALTQLSGDLESYLTTIDYGNASENTWVKPSGQQLLDFETMFLEFNAGNYDAAHQNASTLGYEVIEFTDNDTSDAHYILKEINTPSQSAFMGGGTYVQLPTGRNAVLQVPHPSFDSNTAQQGIETYLKVRPRLLMLAGTHRNDSTSRSYCTNASYQASDVAHQTQSYFYIAHTVMSSEDTSTLFFQLHGFGASSLTTLQTQCNSSNSKLINMSEGLNYATPESERSLLHIFRRKVEAGGKIEACVFGNDTTSLGGTWNVEGRYTNHSHSSCYNDATISTKRFIHLEQSADVRSNHRDDIANYIDQTLTEYFSQTANPFHSNTLLGIYHGNQGWFIDDITALEAWQEKKNAVITLFANFNPDQQNNVFTHQLPNLWNNGNIPLISWEPYLQATGTPDSIERDIVNGDHDIYLNSWISDLKIFLSGPDSTFNTADDRRIYLRLAHEMNGNWYPWSAVNADESPQDYIAMWRHIHDIFTGMDIGKNHVQWIWSTSATDHNAYPRMVEHYYPGDEYVDWLGVDGYGRKTSDTNSSVRMPARVFGNIIPRLRLISKKPISINETGAYSAAGTLIGEKTVWLEKFFAYVKEHNIQLISWFNKDLEKDWAIFDGLYGDTTSTAGETVYSAYKTGVQSNWIKSSDISNPRLLDQITFEGTPNIARQHGVATQGSNYGSSVASLAIDGDENTTNHTGCNADNNWWQVSLPETSMISRIVVKNRSSWRSRLNGSDVYITDTAYSAPLNEADKVYTLDSSDTQEITLPAAKSGAYVIVKAAGDNCLHMRELEVYGEVPLAPKFNTHETSHLIAQTKPLNSIVATLTAIDLQNDTLSYSIVGNVPFAVDSQGNVTVSGALSIGDIHTFDVIVSDGTNTASSALTITIKASTAPEFSGGEGHYAVAENAATNTSVGFVKATDVDLDLLTYSIVETGTPFQIDASSGEITVSESIDRNAGIQQTITIAVTDQATSIEQQQTIFIIPTANANTTGILLEHWTSISGNSVSDLTSIANYPANPTQTSILTSFEAPSQDYGSYGQRVSGYLTVAESAEYTFWIASDDESELRLSTDTSPANMGEPIASVDGWTSSQQWTKYTSQKSEPITLIAGRLYYIEALHKEGSGGDHIAVALQKTGDISQTLISGAQVIPPYVVDGIAPTTPTGLGTDSVSSSNVEMVWSAASDAIGVVSYKIYRDGVLIATLAGSVLHYTDNSVSANT